MQSITKEIFSSVIINGMTDLLKFGYQVKQEEPAYNVELFKISVAGVYCLIGFDLFKNLGHTGYYKILLIRRRTTEFSHKDYVYSPLIVDFRNLMSTLYKINILPPNDYAWKFTDERTLQEQIPHIQSLLIDHGIKWLEDPMSNMDWINKDRR